MDHRPWAATWIWGAIILVSVGTVDGRVVATDGSNQDAIQTLSGVLAGSTDLGTFTGTTITDNTDTKTALQDLETGVEGTSAIIGNNPPNQNLFVGTNAGGGLTSGTGNTLIGESAGTAISTESQNTFLGTIGRSNKHQC